MQNQPTDDAPDPQGRYQSPEMLIADDTLSYEEKYALLREWDLEISHRLKAEEEGMSASDPVHTGQEAKWADESARVKTCLTELALKLGYD